MEGWVVGGSLRRGKGKKGRKGYISSSTKKKRGCEKAKREGGRGHQVRLALRADAKKFKEEKKRRGKSAHGNGRNGE